MKVNQLRVGALLSYVNLAIGSIIPMIYTPIMLRILGQAEYGLYSLSNSIVGYLSLLNFGFGSTIIRYICKYRAEGKKEQVRSIFGLFLIIYGIVSVLVIKFLMSYIKKHDFKVFGWYRIILGILVLATLVF